MDYNGYIKSRQGGDSQQRGMTPHNQAPLTIDTLSVIWHSVETD